MPRVPFIGRLYLQEYLALVGSFCLLGLESIIRVITLALPGPIIRFFYNLSSRLFNWLSSSQGRRLRNKKKAISSPIAQASDFTELCELYGYYAEEHIVQTGDGYLLGLHRLGYRRGEEDERVNAGEGSIQKKVAYLHHGLMMNSEVWVCLTEKERCLPFVLVEQGYDVWLGNNRGNKYSKKSVKFSPTSPEFWNYSIDEFAFHDIPDSIDYILNTTRQPSLSYIGFSQGTAQAFATLSIHPNLNEKIDVFVALAPAMSPPGLASGIVSSFIKASPEVLFLAFGRKGMLSSTTMWQALLYPAIFSWAIDMSMKYLFGWHSQNMTAHQKLAAYPHLFSFSSTKSVVHWLQIIRNSTFQMFDDEVQGPFSMSTAAKYYKVAKYPTRNIKTPIVLLYGGSDSLVDIKIMLKELPKHTVAKEVPHYEHLDFLWASDVDKLVIPHVLDALSFYASGSGRKRIHFTPHRDSLSPAPFPPSYSEDERGPKLLQKTAHNDDSNALGDTELDAAFERRKAIKAAASPRRSHAKNRRSLESTTSLTPGSPVASQVTERSTASRPEGWWSSDEVAGTSENTSPTQGLKSADVNTSPSGAARGSSSPGRVGKPSHKSQRSTDSARSSHASIGQHGISIGAGKALAAEGVISQENTAAQRLRLLDEVAMSSDSSHQKRVKKR